MKDMDDALLDRVIDASVIAGDLAVLNAPPGSIRTKADETRVAIAAAVKAAVANGLLEVTDDAAERLARGVQIAP